MKTRFWMMVLAVTAVVGLSGCTTTFTSTQQLQRFDSGESVLYVHVKGVNRDLSKVNCPGNNPGILSKKGFDALANEICPKINEFQTVGSFIHSSPSKGVTAIKSWADKRLNIERGDIIKISKSMAPDGTLDHPSMVISIARKAQDATKESGCYWEGAGLFTNAFVSGGVVCDGWDWKKQKFAQ